MAQSSRQEYNKAWVRDHREHVNARARAYKAKHREKILARQRAAYWSNPEHARALAKKSYAKRIAIISPEKAECRKQRMRNWYHANRDLQLEKKKISYNSSNSIGHSNIMGKVKKYGLTLDEYATIEEDQNWVCAICGKEARLNLDHNHSTGKARQFLCSGCNIAIGVLESPLFYNYQQYLKRHN